MAGTPLERERGRELPEEIMPDAHAFLAYTVTELYEEKCRRVDPLFYFYFLIFIGVLLLYRAQRGEMTNASLLFQKEKRRSVR